MAHNHPPGSIVVVSLAVAWRGNAGALLQFRGDWSGRRVPFRSS